MVPISFDRLTYDLLSRIFLLLMLFVLFVYRLAKSIVDGDEEEVRNALKVFNPDDKCVLINISVQKLQDIYTGNRPLH